MMKQFLKRSLILGGVLILTLALALPALAAGSPAEGEPAGSETTAEVQVDNTIGLNPLPPVWPLASPPAAAESAWA